MTDSIKNRVITVRLTEADYAAADARRSSRGQKFQGVLESFLIEYGKIDAVRPSTNPPVPSGPIDEQIALIERSAPGVGVGLRTLIQALLDQYGEKKGAAAVPKWSDFRKTLKAGKVLLVVAVIAFHVALMGKHGEIAFISAGVLLGVYWCYAWLDERREKR